MTRKTSKEILAESFREVAERKIMLLRQLLHKALHSMEMG